MADYTIDFKQATKDYANAFCLKAQKGKTVELKATSGKFAIYFRNADKFFDPPVGTKLTINIDSMINAGIDPICPTLTIRNNLPVDTEIKYEVCCLSSVPVDWADAPPRIIVVS
jgi:hypothetical protein